MRRAAALVTVVGLVGLLAPVAQGAPETYRVSSQAWWSREGLDIPARVGSHIHLDATLPAGVVTGSALDIPVTITLHDMPGRVTWVRACRQSSNCQRWDVSLGPCADCSLPLTLRYTGFGGWPIGTDELRLSANVADAEPTRSGSQRQFQSTGWPVSRNAATPVQRSSVYYEARGWYAEGHGYANARIRTKPWDLRPGAVVRFRAAPGSEGDPTREWLVTLDPDFHHGDAGRVLRSGTAACTDCTVTLPADLAPGTHRLVVVSSDGQNAGVLAMPFEVG